MGRFHIVLIAIFFAALPLRAERPFRTDDPWPVGLYRWEASGGVTIGTGSWEQVRDRTQVTMNSQFDYGVTDRSELGIGFDFYQTNDPGPDGFGDGLLHYKHLFWPATPSNPDISLDFTVKLPTASRKNNLGSGRADFGIISLYGWDRAPWKTTARLGYVIVGGRPTLRNRIEFGVATRYQAAQDVEILGELYFDSNEKSGQSGRFRFSGGTAFKITRSLTVDAMLSAGIRDAVPDVEAKVGFRTGI